MKSFQAVVICVLLVFVSLICSAIGQANKTDRVRPSKMGRSNKTVQMRIFTINKGKMDAFLDAWLKGVYPLREKNGFKIEKAWTVRNKNKFIWILSYDGPEGFQAKDSAYYSSAARKVLDPDPAQYIADVEYLFLDYVVKP